MAIEPGDPEAESGDPGIAEGAEREAAVAEVEGGAFAAPELRTDEAPAPNGSSSDVAQLEEMLRLGLKAMLKRLDDLAIRIERIEGLLNGHGEAEAEPAPTAAAVVPDEPAAPQRPASAGEPTTVRGGLGELIWRGGSKTESGPQPG